MYEQNAKVHALHTLWSLMYKLDSDLMCQRERICLVRGSHWKNRRLLNCSSLYQGDIRQCVVREVDLHRLIDIKHVDLVVPR